MHDESRGTVSETDGQPALNAGARLDRTARSGWVALRWRERQNHVPWLHGYVVVVALSILVLICSGGMVTSKNAGLAVPDWPNSYGYNMFAFPVSRWVGAVFLEHTHRLAATVVGTLTIGLVLLLVLAERRRWVRTLGYVAFGLVVLQGVLGGLRVVLVADWIGIFHGCTAQAFLALVSVVALVTSRWWLALGAPDSRRPQDPAILAGFGRKLIVIAVLIYVQLALGAAMRHAHAGLSIPDFPTAYGHWWPQVHKADLPALNHQRTEVLHEPPTTLAQIHLQMTHRMMAIFIILPSVLAVAAGAWRRRDILPDSLRWFASAGVVLVGTQVTLGIYTIWTKKAADVATAHVAVGASLLVWSVLTCLALQRWRTTKPGGSPSRPATQTRGGCCLMKPATLLEPGALEVDDALIPVATVHPSLFLRYLRTGQSAADLVGARHDAGRVLHGLERSDGLCTAVEHDVRHGAGGGGGRRVESTPRTRPGRPDAPHPRAPATSGTHETGHGVAHRFRVVGGWAAVPVFSWSTRSAARWRR